MTISAIICAAGKGARAGFGKNKLLVPLQGAPALFHTLEKFKGFDEIIVTSSPDDIAEITAISSPFNAKVVIGGNTRTQSVANALNCVTGDVVLIHDGARPYVTSAAIEACISSVLEYGSGICAVPATDTMAICDNGQIKEVPERSNIYCLQTPQGFKTKDIKQAYKKAQEDNLSFTDDSSVYAKYCGKPHICMGEQTNIKLTYKEQFSHDTPMLLCKNGQAIGLGIDTHAFGKEQNYVTLCGVKVPHTIGLIAHSDGDVAVHAIMDALLGGAGLEDIGHYFPDTDEKFSGADSLELLKQVIKILKDKGYVPLNIAVTIQAEKPKLAKHILAMKQNIAACCNLLIENVGVSAGTCEHLGFVGQQLGITATAIALLEKTGE